MGHTEAAVDLARLAGLEPAGVIVEIMNEDGTMAGYRNYEIAVKHGLKSYPLKIWWLIEWLRKVS